MLSTGCGVSVSRSVLPSRLKTVRDEPGFDFPDWWGTVFEWCSYVAIGGWFIAGIPYALGNQKLVVIISILSGIAFLVAVAFTVLMKIHYHAVTGRWRGPKKKHDDDSSS
jgi:hypothetical protein